ncbi:hypothetical protein AVEN_183068-1 [Araneus ventricosus]|uniref:Uncharacterized protein n=1 Tax=Araneus ventricosus TaxID=182803 RepID=A0A4Y2MD29_ARAVE|nr:hypothetical protein AVEN_183068-1 [Araneus ventricosus]
MQFGFRKQLSTVQQLLRITEIMKEGMDEGWDTETVFLDIAKAFDRVWTDGLLYRLIMMRIPGGLIRLMATYLRGRRFAVRVGSDLSSERAIDAGGSTGIQDWTSIVQYLRQRLSQPQELPDPTMSIR